MTNASEKERGRFWARLWTRLWTHPGHLFWVLLAYIPLLGWMSIPLTGDQKVYLSIAMEMRQAGEWLKPLLFGQPSYFKPPFQYWMTLLGWKAFGFNLWGALLPSALAVVLTGWMLGEIASLLHERRWFVNAGLWFAATLATATYGATAQMEIYVCLFYSAAWWAGLKYLAAPFGKRNESLLYLAFAIAGASALVKSPLYSVFWVLGYLTYLIISGEWELFRSKHLYLSWLLGIGIGASWFLVILGVDGTRFWADYAVRETWDKKAGNNSTVPGFWVASLYLCWPFSFMLIPSVRSLWRAGYRVSATFQWIVCWGLLPALFFTFYPYRVRAYLFIFVPMLAVVLDMGYFRSGRSKFFRAIKRLSGVSSFLLLFVLSLVILRAQLASVWIALGFLTVGVFAVICAYQDWMRGFALSSLAAVFFFHATAVTLGEQDIADLRKTSNESAGARLGLLDENRNIWSEVGLLSVALSRPIERIESMDGAKELLKAGGVLILSDEQTSQLSQLHNGFGSNALADHSWKRLKGRARFPYRELILYGRGGVPGFDDLVHRQFHLVSLKVPIEIGASP